MQWITPKQTPTKSTIPSAIQKYSEFRSSAQNLGTRSRRLRSTSSSWPAMINHNIVNKPLHNASQVNSRAFEIRPFTWGCISFWDFWNTRTGWLTLRGLFHQKIYITKFMAAYASVTISRWVTGRCSMACAMHCITNHDVWSRTRV